MSAVLTPENAPLLINKRKTYGGRTPVPLSTADRGLVLGIYGPGGCLDGDTTIRYEIRRENGYRQSHGDWTLRRLYERFHKLDHPLTGDGRGKYQRPSTVQSDLYTQSIDETGVVRLNRVVGAHLTGVKECYRLRTSSGECIVATADHNFFTGERYVPLELLSLGDRIMRHNYSRVYTPRWTDRAYIYVKHHPYARVKTVRDTTRGYVNRYHALTRARAAVEARLNNIPLIDYINRLNDNRGDLHDIQFLDPSIEVHHQDGSIYNDDPSNLILLSKAEHARHHVAHRGAIIQYEVIPTYITSVEPIEERETFDLTMASPYNNYIANGIVVHNSGKTTAAATITDSELGAPALYLDARGNPHVIASYTNRIDTIEVRKFDEVAAIRRDLENDRDCLYKSVIIDNCSELFFMDLRDTYGPDADVTWQQHSRVTADLLQMHRNFVDLSTGRHRMNVIFVYQEAPEARTIRGKDVPSRSEISLNKSLQAQVPSIVNFLGRLYVVDQSPSWVRVLDFTPSETLHQAKLQVDPNDEYAKQIPYELFNPSLASILNTIRGRQPWPTELHADPKLKGGGAAGYIRRNREPQNIETKD